MTNEATVQDRVRLAVAENGGIVWRNNIGAYQDDHGNFIRYGLANDSQKMNKIVKSSDLIGIMPIVIQPHHIGQTLGVFMAIECKHSGWNPLKLSQHERAQQAYLNLVQKNGGIAGFCAHPEQFVDYVKRFK